MPSSKLTDYYLAIAENPSYAVLGAVFRPTLEEISSALWEDDLHEARQMIITALELAEKVDDYYDEQA